MADSKLAAPRVDSSSPAPHCAICLGTCKNKSRANSCSHEFCYNCLLEWSKIKAECPLCKQEFKSILHNYKSTTEFDVHIVEAGVPPENNRFIDNASMLYIPPATPPIDYYQFRTTLTVNSSDEHAIQQMLLHHPLFHQFHPERPFRYPHHRRRRGDTSTSFRRSVYNDNLWVYAPPDITGRYRDVSPAYFRNNPAARTRLVPWLNRDLNALLHENTQHVMHLVDIILDHLMRHHICSYIFRSLLYDYLGNKTDHFIHEFYNFMRSPFDMVGYDRNVIYTERQHSSSLPYYVDEVDVSEYDSDVILVSDGPNSQTITTTDPVVIDLVETDSDEPIIVSEERHEPRLHDLTQEGEVEEKPKPLLPLKLRLKDKYKKERRKGKKRHKQMSDSDSSGSSNTDSDYDYRRYKQKKMLKKMRREKKRKREYYIEKPTDDEDNVTLDNFLKKKRSKHNTFSKHKSSHTVTSEKKYKESKSSGCSSSSENDFKIYRSKRLKSEDKSNAGPSSGRLRNTLKKEVNSNYWYSRPSANDSDSSDS